MHTCTIKNWNANLPALKWHPRVLHWLPWKPWYRFLWKLCSLDQILIAYH